MKMKGLAASLLMLSLASVGIPAAFALQGPPPPAVPGYGPMPPPPRPGWDTPPAIFRTDLERRAFHEGILGAQRDRQNGRIPNVNNRDEYMRRTAFPVPTHMIPAYRRAFRAGYERGVQIFYGPRRS
jgi:hypothetical protein